MSPKQDGKAARRPLGRSRRLLAAVLVVFMLLLSGCWDVREINQLAMVMGVGIDKSDTPGRYLVTIQVARPAAAAGKGGGGGSGTAGGDTGAVYTASADGDTIFTAVRNLAQFTSRRIMWAHNDIIVIGESLAREDITPVVDFFTRNPELRMRTWVAVARGTTARDLLSAKTGMETIPADSLSALFRYAQLPGESIRSDMGDVADAIFDPELEPVLSALQKRQRAVSAGENREEHGTSEQVELRGSAVFQETKLVGFVDSDAGRGLQLLRRQQQNTLISVPSPGDETRNIAVELRSPRIKIESDVSGDVPRFHIDVKVNAWLAEQDVLTPKLDTPELKAQVEKAAAQKIIHNIDAIMKALQQDMKTDGVDFGQVVHIQHSGWWHENESRWADLFPQVEYETTVEVHLSKMGLYARPMNLKAP